MQTDESLIAEYLRASLTSDRSPTLDITFPSGATARVTISKTPTRAVVMVTPDYEPDPRQTHPEDVARILAAIADINATIPSRFGRPLATVTVAFQSGEQYALTKPDADWIHTTIHAVCPVVKRWIGHGGEWCISHEVNPSEIVTSK